MNNSILTRIFLLGFILFSNTYANDTLRLKYNETYVLLSGMFLSIKVGELKIDSVIRGNIDTRPHIYHPFCTNNIEKGKNYITLSTVEYDNKGIFKAINSKCNILPDTPENREFLIRKWENTKVIYENIEPGQNIKRKDIDL